MLSVAFVHGQVGYSEVLDYYHRKMNFNGSVIVATKDGVEFSSAIGIADRQNHAQITTQTRFKIASITKTFTAVLILKLYEKGKIDFNGTIGKYYPEYTGEGKDKVNIHHLLTYSSGIPNCEGQTGIAVYQSPSSVEDFVAKHCSGNLEFEPGTQFSYNNADYIILGRIIEKITGKTFDENLWSEILRPLKMENTNMLYSRDVITDLADTYYQSDSSMIFYRDDPMYIENYFSAGAMYSCTEDLLKFDRGIFKFEILQKKTVDLMLTSYPELYGVAYGFWVTDEKFGDQKIRVANRQGSIWGANAYWLHLIDDNKTIIVLSNTNATNLNALTEQLVLLVTKQASTLPKTQ